MSRPFMDILKLIEAHFENDDEKFNNYARVIADYYKKDGNIEGTDEILELIKTGHITPRTSPPAFYKEPEHNEYVYSSKTIHKEDTLKEINHKEEIKEVVKGDINKEKITSKRQYKRTKDEIKANKVNKVETIKEPDKPKRHRRTKAELEKDGYYTKEVKINKNKIELQPDVIKKRHRRTKAELIADGYYNDKK